VEESLTVNNERVSTELALSGVEGLDMTESKDEYAKPLKGKRYFKDESV
jgi:hypothetical protein